MKKILSLILVLVMMLSVVACNDKGNTPDDGEGNKEPEKITYTVTAIDSNGKPVSNVEITFSPKGGTEFPFPTDETGKVTYKTDKELTVKVTKVPAGYEYDKMNVAQSFDENAILAVVLTVIPEGDPYVIKVVDQDGNPVEGARVQMCSDACKAPIYTGADGTASYPYEEGDFHAQITKLPEGYSVEDMDAYYDFVDGVATITITKN